MRRANVTSLVFGMLALCSSADMEKSALGEKGMPGMYQMKSPQQVQQEVLAAAANAETADEKEALNSAKNAVAGKDETGSQKETGAQAKSEDTEGGPGCVEPSDKDCKKCDEDNGYYLLVTSQHKDADLNGVVGQLIMVGHCVKPEERPEDGTSNLSLGGTQVTKRNCEDVCTAPRVEDPGGNTRNDVSIPSFGVPAFTCTRICQYLTPVANVKEFKVCGPKGSEVGGETVKDKYNAAGTGPCKRSDKRDASGEMKHQVQTPHSRPTAAGGLVSIVKCNFYKQLTCKPIKVQEGCAECKDQACKNEKCTSKECTTKKVVRAHSIVPAKRVTERGDDGEYSTKYVADPLCQAQGQACGPLYSEPSDKVKASHIEAAEYTPEACEYIATVK